MKGHTKRKINYKKTKKNHKRTKLIGGYDPSYNAFVTNSLKNQFRVGDFVTIKRDSSTNNNNNNNNNNYTDNSGIDNSGSDDIFKIKEIHGNNAILVNRKGENETFPISSLKKTGMSKPSTGTSQQDNNNNNTNNNTKNNIDFQIPNILRKFDYFCFDFDDTLAYNHTNPDKHLSLDQSALSLTGKELLDYFYDAKKLIKLIVYLVTNGKKIFIISLGDSYIITTLLNKLINSDSGHNNDIENNIFKDGENVFGFLKADKSKNSEEELILYEQKKIKYRYNPEQYKYDVISDIINKYKIKKQKKIIFFDDDFNNTKKMNKNGISAVTVPGKKSKMAGMKTIFNDGFNLNILMKIDEDIEKRRLQPSEYMIREDYLFESFAEDKQYRELSFLNRLKIIRNEKKSKKVKKVS